MIFVDDIGDASVAVPTVTSVPDDMDWRTLLGQCGQLPEPAEGVQREKPAAIAHAHARAKAISLGPNPNEWDTSILPSERSELPPFRVSQELHEADLLAQTRLAMRQLSDCNILSSRSVQLKNSAGDRMALLRENPRRRNGTAFVISVGWELGTIMSENEQISILARRFSDLNLSQAEKGAIYKRILLCSLHSR